MDRQVCGILHLAKNVNSAEIQLLSFKFSLHSHNAYWYFLTLINVSLIIYFISYVHSNIRYYSIFSGLGLKTVKECKPSSDAVCGALEGNYCIDPYEGGCRAAKEHTTCKPGHFIKHPGTDSTDTVCEICPERSFSNGSSISCTPHTDCESKGLPTIKPGDSVSDSQCGNKSWEMIVFLSLLGMSVLLLAGGGVIGYFFYIKRKRKQPNRVRQVWHFCAW
uniref:TNFR-Cys domain-containing protein n=1 Tax=Scleropages formosus TaxID=113540 RepID=A0A8C9W195_SCLFO